MRKGEKLRESGSPPVFFLSFLYILSHSVSSSHMLMNAFARGVYRSQNSMGGEPYLVCVCCSCSSGRQRQTPLLSVVHSPSVWHQTGMVIDVDCSWLVVSRKLESARERRRVKNLGRRLMKLCTNTWAPCRIFANAKI